MSSAERRFLPWRRTRNSLTSHVRRCSRPPCLWESLALASCHQLMLHSQCTRLDRRSIRPHSCSLALSLLSPSRINFTSEFSGVLLYIWATTGSVLHASWDLIIAVWNRWNGTYLITGSRICNFLTSARRGHMQGSNRVYECPRHLSTFVVLGVSTWSPIVFSPIIWPAWNERMVSLKIKIKPQNVWNGPLWKFCAFVPKKSLKVANTTKCRKELMVYMAEKKGADRTAYDQTIRVMVVSTYMYRYVSFTYSATASYKVRVGENLWLWKAGPESSN